MPEKTTKEINPQLRTNYERGIEAIKASNFEYAIKLLQSVLETEPGLLAARQALRVAQKKKFGAGGAAKKMGAFFGGLGAMTKGSIASSKHPIEAMNQAENMLNEDPTNATALNMLAQAAESAGFLLTAVWTLEVMRDQNPKDIAHLRRMATLYMHPQIRNTEKAKETYEAIMAIRPTDQEALKGLKDATAVGSIMGGGWEEAKTYRDVIKDKSQAESLEQAARAHKSDDILTNQIAETEAKLQTDPDNLVHYRKLGDLYTQKREFDKALEYLNVALQRTGGDPSLEASIADTTRRKYDHLIAEVQLEYGRNKSDDLKAKLDKLETEKALFQVTDCERRRDRYPNDLDIRFEMGQLYMSAGRIDEAIKEFQLAQRNPRRRIQTLSYIGQCFAKKNYLDLAVEQFKKGIAEHPLFDALKKELYYNLGLVYERMKKEADAMDQYKKIMEADFSYKDVAQKVEAYYKKQAGQSDAGSPPAA